MTCNCGGCSAGCPADDCCCERDKCPRVPSYNAASDNMPGCPPPFRTEREANVKEEREPIAARILDIKRNFGPARGIIDFFKQNMASTYTPVIHFDLKRLPGWDEDDAKEMKDNLLCWDGLYLDDANWIDAAGCLNRTKLTQLFIEECETYGEVFTLTKHLDPKKSKKYSNRPFGTSIQFINPLRIDDPFDCFNPDGSRKENVYQGITFDKVTGRPTGAYIHPQTTVQRYYRGIQDLKPQKVPFYGTGNLTHRRVMMHFFEKISGDQIRGISPFVSSVESLELWRRLNRAIAIRAERQTRAMGVIKSECDQIHDPQTGKRMLGDQAAEGYSEWDRPDYKDWANASPKVKDNFLRGKYHEANKTKEKLKDVGLDYLALYTDEDVEHFQVDNGRLAANELIGSIVDTISSAHGISTNQVLRNYTDGNYTGQRSGRIDTVNTFKRKKVLTDQFNQYLWMVAGEESIESGLLKLPRKVVSRFRLNTPKRRHDYIVKYLEPILKHKWAMPRPQIIEDSKDADGIQKMLDIGATLHSDVIAMAGYDRDTYRAKKLLEGQEDIDDEIALMKYRAQKIAECEELNTGDAGDSESPPPIAGIDFSAIKTKCDAYGVAVRAGKVTPQPEDEIQARQDLSLPPMNKSVHSLWTAQGNARAPITIKSAEETESEADSAAANNNPDEPIEE